MNKLKQLWSNLRSSLWFLRLLVRRATGRHSRVLRVAFSGFLWWSALTTPVMAQGDAAGPQAPPVPKTEEVSLAPAKVAVQPLALDEEIRQRLQSVMEATGWFNAPEVNHCESSGRVESAAGRNLPSPKPRVSPIHPMKHPHE